MMMNKISAGEIKSRARELGADLCGIAPLERFADAPQGFHPTDVLAPCRSVIVIAIRFPASSLAAASPSVYTFVRNRVMEQVDAVSSQLAAELESIGACAVPIPSSEPYDYWDEQRRHGQGILSLKHAAVRAGLGRMGKNTLLINEQLGNMLWLGAVLIDAELEPDPLAEYQACMPDCRICLDSCPAQALDGTTIQQSRCRDIAWKSTPGGGGVYTCNVCRKVCPRRQGLCS